MNIPKMDCIGRISPMDLFAMQGFSVCQNSQGIGSIPEFNNAVIIDFGSGASDFLETIGRISNPQALIGIDILYQSFDTYRSAIATTVKSIQSNIRVHREKNLKNTGVTGDTYHLTEAIFVGNQQKRKLRVLEDQYNLNTTDITRLPAIEYLPEGKADYIFVTHLFHFFQNREVFLSTLGRFLKEDGKVIITDYCDGNDKIQEGMKFLVSLIKKGAPGVQLLGVHGNDVSISITKEALQSL